MENELLQQLMQLDSVTLIEFKNYLKEHIIEVCTSNGSNAKIISNNLKEKKLCSNCNNVLCKNGHMKNGTQKYICKNCKHSFCETSGTVTYCSKEPFEIWKNVIDNLIDGLSIRRIANKNNISATTSFSMRHKILNCLQSFLNSVVLSGRVQGDEKFVNINLKGTKQNNMPRFSKKRTSSSGSGISKHEVCILSAIDESDNLILQIGGTSRLSNKMLDDNLTSKIEKGATLITDSASPYRKFCLKNNLNHIAIPSGNYANLNDDNLAEINGIHSQLEIWLTKFHGVSIRHLQQYLDWFSYIFMMAKKFKSGKLETELYKNIIISNNYISTIKISKKEIPIDLYSAYGDYNYGIYAN